MPKRGYFVHPAHVPQGVRGDEPLPPSSDDFERVLRQMCAVPVQGHAEGMQAFAEDDVYAVLYTG